MKSRPGFGITLGALLGATMMISGCGNVPKVGGDASSATTIDARATPRDGGTPDATAVIDARPALTSSPRVELTSGAGKIEGASYKMQVQIGHPMSQQPASGGDKKIEGAAAVKR